jgi:hypothetical protein
MKYTLINKFTGKLDNDYCGVYNDQNMPINEYVLQYVAITQEMIDLIEHKVVDTLLDHSATKYNLQTNTWEVVTKEIPKPNITQNRQRDLDNLKLEAAKYIQITDLPAAFRLEIDNYITQLNSLVIPTDTSDRNSTQQAAIVWPVRPW